jgi:protein-tyrosine kinase
MHSPLPSTFDPDEVGKGDSVAQDSGASTADRRAREPAGRASDQRGDQRAGQRTGEDGELLTGHVNRPGSDETSHPVRSQGSVHASSHVSQQSDHVDETPADSRIGTLLQHAGKLTTDGIERVLRAQQESGLHFGAAAMRLGLVEQEDIDAAVARQFAYPVAAKGHSTLAPQLVAAFHPASAQGDILRAIRSQLLLRWFGSGRHALAVSGVESGEASSVLAANLALVFAQLGQRTLLVDANLRQGIQHTLFGLHPDGVPHRRSLPGLADVLAGRAGLDAIRRVSGFPALSLLGAGTVPPNPQELLERPSFAALHNQLGKLYDVVLFDVAPTSHGAEALAVAAHAGAALLVAHKDRTPIAALKRMAQQMSAAKVTVIGSVLVEA